MIYPKPIPWSAPGRAARRPWSRKKLWKTVLACALLVGAALTATAVLGLTFLILRIRGTLPSVQQIAAFRPAEPTRIMSSDGVVLAELAMENRQVVPLKAISPRLVDATLAVEDSRFYEHGGFDLRGIGRAAWANLSGGDITSQGGSTITQQLARNVNQFGLSNQKSLTRKLREMLTAVRIEQVFSKPEILELYLNQVYYGGGAYGVEAASHTYFGKSASKLSLAEAALLAGLPQRPSSYSPFVSKDAAVARRNTVLQRMVATGKITQADYSRASSEPLHLAKRSADNRVFKAPYFVDWVVQQLVAKYGVDAVYSGWRVDTTLNWEMQQAAERAVQRPLGYGATQAALVSIDPHSGEVRAMVGGRDYRRDRFNAITQGRRQPGSAFKAFVYSAAMDTGTVGLGTTFRDEPISYPSGDKQWSPHNYEAKFSYSRRTVLDAIVHSINTVAVQTADETGIDKVIYYAHRMGISTDLEPYLPLALGASAVRPIEICSAYGAFAAGGERFQPTGIHLVRDSRGEVVEMDEASARRVPAFLHPDTISRMDYALHEVVQRGTGTAAAAVPNAFGKTGTTSDLRDAWFVGFTPNLVTAVWCASPHRQRHGAMEYRSMPGGTGGHLAAPIWAAFMSRADNVQRISNRLTGRPKYSIAVTAPADEDASAPPDGSQAASVRSADAGLDRQLGGQYAAQAAAAAGGSPDDGTEALPPGTMARIVYARNSAPRAYQSAPVASATGERRARICADTGDLATDWCPTTVIVTVPANHGPMTYCRLHRPASAGE